MKTKIHVNQHNIKHNKKTGDFKPVLTCKTYKSNLYAHEVAIYDKNDVECAKIVYRPNKPLSCGATVWVETENKIELTTYELTNERRSKK